MEISSFQAQEIQITSVYFRTPKGHDQFETFPRQMVYEGHEYTFTELGMKYLIQKGQQLIRLFDMTDGKTDYRLKLEGENNWTLVNMKTAI